MLLPIATEYQMMFTIYGRRFLFEYAPVLSGSDDQDHLQEKTARVWNSTVSGADESLPPGFELYQKG